MDMLSCLICLGGDVRQKHHRSTGNPVSWPEVYVLEMVHGRGNVQDMKVVATAPDNAKEEKLRLASIYDPKIVEQVYPGLIPAMEMEAPGDIPRAEEMAEAETAPAAPSGKRPPVMSDTPEEGGEPAEPAPKKRGRKAQAEPQAEDLGLPETEPA